MPLQAGCVKTDFHLLDFTELADPKEDKSGNKEMEMGTRQHQKKNSRERQHHTMEWRVLPFPFDLMIGVCFVCRMQSFPNVCGFSIKHRN